MIEIYKIAAETARRQASGGVPERGS